MIGAVNSAAVVAVATVLVNMTAALDHGQQSWQRQRLEVRNIAKEL
jgi:hypothetical protein